MSKQNWNAQHLKYSQTEWINRPSLFAQYAIKFFPETGRIIDIGCGQGQDSRYFSEHGYDVVGIDFSENGINLAKQKSESSKIDFEVMDISEPLSFEDASFDVVYSHLAVHYFNSEKTKQIFRELSRILKIGGILAVFVNSVNDPEYKTGSKIEEDYFFVYNMEKRYFSKKSLQSYIKGFETLILNEEGETYKDRAVGVSNLVQFIGRKLK